MNTYGSVAADQASAPGVGACGHTPSVSDVKISPSIFAAPSHGSQLSASCGRTLQASSNGSGWNFTVYDKCKCIGMM